MGGNYMEDCQKITREDFMSFFRDDTKLNELTDDDKIEIFRTILVGSSDITKELLDDILSDYFVFNLEIVENGKGNNWTKEETIIAFNVYCKVPFKSSSKTNPTIIKYANILGRSPYALNMKVGNFGRLDPELKKQGITGLEHGSKLEEIVWDEFNDNWDKLAFESEKLIAEFQSRTIEEIEIINIEDLPKGEDRETIIKTRVNQSFFRSAILSSYNLKCCVTGLSIPVFLVASHIKPWSEDKDNRTNPHNGLCLNSIHDKAFDKGFITVTPDFKILVSKYFDDYSNDVAANDFFNKYQNQPIILPNRFLPSKEFLDYHYNQIFIK